MQKRHADQDQRHFADIEKNIDDTYPLLFRARADKADNSRRHAVTQIYADNDRIYGLKGQKARCGEGLQDTDRRRGALQDERDSGACQIAQYGVIAEACEQPLHHTGFCQNIDGTGHIHQSGEQDTEADRYISDLL